MSEERKKYCVFMYHRSCDENCEAYFKKDNIIWEGCSLVKNLERIATSLESVEFSCAFFLNILPGQKALEEAILSKEGKENERTS